MKIKWLILLAACSATGVMADVFGTGANEFELTFEQISSDSNPSSGLGIVDYDYGIGTHEVTADQWNKYRNVSTPVGPGTANYPNTSGNQPVNRISWYEGAQFVNWLNTSQGHQAAYNYVGSSLNMWDEGDQSASSVYRHKDAVYSLPSEDEWVKAAYWNGTSLQSHSTQNNSFPVAGVDARYSGAIWDVGSGTEELNGTYDMVGNVMEWTDNTPYGSSSGNPTSARRLRGGAYNTNTADITDPKTAYNPLQEYTYVGFRVAAIPEPASIALIGLFGGGILALRRIFML